MPGPASRAMIWMPRLPPLTELLSVDITISPFFAWSTMVRATSEIAAAIRVTSAPLKPNSSASERPRWRAVTISVADRISVSVSVASMHRHSFRFRLVEKRQTLFQIQRRADAFERQSKLDHRQGDIRLDADNDGLGSTQ